MFYGVINISFLPCLANHPQIQKVEQPVAFDKIWSEQRSDLDRFSIKLFLVGFRCMTQNLLHTWAGFPLPVT